MSSHTLHPTNMAVDYGPLEDCFPLRIGGFSTSMIVSGRVSLRWSYLRRAQRSYKIDDSLHQLHQRMSNVDGGFLRPPL